MKIGIVGCGFVSALYLRTIQLRPNLSIVGVTDILRERSVLLAKHANCPVFDTYQELLDRSGADIILNLTNPKSHYDVNHAALLAGKHVYCEKPLATEFSQARELTDLAERLGLRLSGAPCNVLSEVAQAVWGEIRRDSVGPIRLVYAELDDGMVHRAPYRRWVNEFGIPWPAKDEFEVGCTLEHAGYYLTWLAAFFGPAVSITVFGATTVPNKLGNEPLDIVSPDFTVACIQYHSGVTARLTCSIVAEHNHRMQIIGDKGTITVHDCWDYRSRANVRDLISIRKRSLLTPWARPIRLPPSPVGKLKRFGAATMDFASGVAELAEAIRFDRPSRLSSEFCLHINELALIIHAGDKHPGKHSVQTGFSSMEPMPWAR